MVAGRANPPPLGQRFFCAPVKLGCHCWLAQQCSDCVTLAAIIGAASDVDACLPANEQSNGAEYHPKHSGYDKQIAHGKAFIAMEQTFCAMRETDRGQVRGERQFERDDKLPQL